MTYPIQRLLSDRRLHLSLSLLVLYGLTWAVIEPSFEERLIDRFEKFCYAEYWVRKPLTGKEAKIAECYRKRYRESLRSLSDPHFDYRIMEQVQAFFFPKGFLYDAWEEEEGGSSYLLAKILNHQRHRREFPEAIEFDYLILGEKEIEPYEEYCHGLETGRLISYRGERICLHRDVLDSYLRWYFESLYLTEPKIPESHYIIARGYKDPKTFFLYQDLKGLCEDVFGRRLFRSKAEARSYFLEQGFNLFLPSLLAMASRMAKDRDLGLHPDERYVRAILAGLSEYPAYTLFYIALQNASRSSSPIIKRMGEDLRGRFEFKLPESINLEGIARVSGELLRRVEEKKL